MSDADLRELVPSDAELREGLTTVEQLTETLSAEQAMARQGEAIKRPTSQAKAQAVPPLGLETIETLAQAVADRVAERIADRLVGLAGQATRPTAAGETIGWPPGRLTVTEPEAAELLGFRRHQLRDRRLKGGIRCTSAQGARPVLYTRENLLDFINRASETGRTPKLHEASERVPEDSA